MESLPSFLQLTSFFYLPCACIRITPWFIVRCDANHETFQASWYLHIIRQMPQHSELLPSSLPSHDCPSRIVKLPSALQSPFSVFLSEWRQHNPLKPLHRGHWSAVAGMEERNCGCFAGLVPELSRLLSAAWTSNCRCCFRDRGSLDSFSEPSCDVALP